MISVNGLNILVVNVRHNGRSYSICSEDFGDFKGVQEDFFNTIETHLSLSSGALSGYELNIATESAVIHPQAKFE